MKYSLSTTALRKSIVLNPRMKDAIDNKLLTDEQAVLNMMEALEREAKYAFSHLPSAMMLLAKHTEEGEPLDEKWSVVYQADEAILPVMVYRAFHGSMEVTAILHYDGFVRVHLEASDQWWNKNNFDDLDVDMIRRVDVANKLSPILAALMLEAGETMMVLKLKADGITSFAVIDEEPRMLSDGEWKAIQHERGYSHCSCGMCGDSNPMGDMIGKMFGGGSGLFGGFRPM